MCQAILKMTITNIPFYKVLVKRGNIKKEKEKEEEEDRTLSSFLVGERKEKLIHSA